MLKQAKLRRSMPSRKKGMLPLALLMERHPNEPSIPVATFCMDIAAFSDTLHSGLGRRLCRSVAEVQIDRPSERPRPMITHDYNFSDTRQSENPTRFDTC